MFSVWVRILSTMYFEAVSCFRLYNRRSYPKDSKWILDRYVRIASRYDAAEPRKPPIRHQTQSTETKTLDRFAMTCWRNFTFMWPCIVTNFFLIKPTEALNSQIYFCQETLHVSGCFLTKINFGKLMRLLVLLKKRCVGANWVPCASIVTSRASEWPLDPLLHTVCAASRLFTLRRLRFFFTGMTPQNWRPKFVKNRPAAVFENSILYGQSGTLIKVNVVYRINFMWYFQCTKLHLFINVFIFVIIFATCHFGLCLIFCSWTTYIYLASALSLQTPCIRPFS